MSRPDFLEAARHCEACWPDEGVCAYLAGPAGWHFLPLPNIADALHAADPSSFPGSARTAFVVEPRAWQAFERAALEATGAGDEPVAWLLHSHVLAPPLLSAFDRDAFTVDGRPLLPRLGLGVFDLRTGRAAGPPVLWRFTAGAWTPAL